MLHQEKFKELYSGLIDNKKSTFKAGEIIKRKEREIQKDNNSVANIPSDEFDINSV